MESTEIRRKLLTLLTAIAPDVDPHSVEPDRDFRDQFDFDSMDSLHFAQAVSEAFGIDVAETDYPNLANLSAADALVAARLAAKAGSGRESGAQNAT